MTACKVLPKLIVWALCVVMVFGSMTSTVFGDIVNDASEEEQGSTDPLPPLILIPIPLPPGVDPASWMVDVPTNHWAYEYINDLIERGIISGYPLEEESMFEFKPGDDITRAELVKLLVDTKKLELIENYEGTEFADWDGVPGWAKPYIAAVAKAGILRGSQEAYGAFVNANNTITLEEMIAMAVRTLEVEVMVDGTSGTRDFWEVSDWAKDYIAFALENRMIDTGEDGSVNGKRYAKRDETAMVLHKLMQYLGG